MEYLESFIANLVFDGIERIVIHVLLILTTISTIIYLIPVMLVQLIGMIRGSVERMHDDHFRGKF